MITQSDFMIEGYNTLPTKKHICLCVLSIDIHVHNSKVYVFFHYYEYSLFVSSVNT